MRTPLDGSPTEFFPNGIECLIEAVVFRMGVSCVGIEQVWLDICVRLPAGDPQTDEPHRLVDPGFGLEEGPGGSENREVVRGWNRQRARPGMGLERTKADL